MRGQGEPGWVKGLRWAGLAAALLLPALVVACGSATPTSPNTGAGGSGGSIGGGITPNTPPTIKSIAAADTPVEVGTPVTLTATVQDAETPVANLTYTWSAPNGTISGSGPVVSWTPGADAVTPGDFTVTLTVVENYTSGSAQLQNTATGTLSMHVNNSPKELADLSLRFLGNFADSRVSPDTCVAEFSTSCSGKKAEFEDITDNRHDFLIMSSTLRHTGIDPTALHAKTTVHTFCQFTSKVITSSPHSGGCLADPASCKLGSVQTATGDCYTTNVYEQGRWWLCESHFNPSRTPTGFERAFFGIRALELP
jgi:hypothetical protein